MPSPGRYPVERGDGLRRGPRRGAPAPVILLVAGAVLVLGALVSPLVPGLLFGLLRLALVLVGFVAIALVAIYLWRRGDVGRFRS